MVHIIASAQSEGSTFMPMFDRGRRVVKMPVDPRSHGMGVGSFIVAEDGEHLLGRVVAITDNADPDDWITGDPTEWYVTVEKPWNITDMQTTIGNAKIEWMEDTLMPRVGRVIDVADNTAFMLGDIVRLETGQPYAYTQIKRKRVGSKLKRMFWRA